MISLSLYVFNVNFKEHELAPTNQLRHGSSGAGGTLPLPFFFVFYLLSSSRSNLCRYASFSAFEGTSPSARLWSSGIHGDSGVGDGAWRSGRLIQYGSSFPRGGETTGEESVGLWSDFLYPDSWEHHVSRLALREWSTGGARLSTLRGGAATSQRRRFVFSGGKSSTPLEL
ncbi:hypothetical protein DY000_02040480 [Brassica cretica]|uniref:Uncharacterized protein n=1 Tax=Brassica cretica TaxID=69181 RepID=A0ABQ7BHR3_BRACR|nr:hypothetical protein DY000_02040480 [Brassica cretica]